MASSKKAKPKLEHSGRSRTIPTLLIRLGATVSLAGLLILALTFAPVILQEINYYLRQWFGPKTAIQTSLSTKPVDSQFGIVIPKLGANAHVIPNVNPYNARAYQWALTKGVAHARGTAVPGALGNIFLFAHSSEDFYNAIRYNSVFYLLPKLVAGDEIIMYYKEVKFTYVVSDKKLVDAKEVSYLELKQGESTLTLMTCWPAGTTLKRLLVFAQLKK